MSEGVVLNPTITPCMTFEVTPQILVKEHKRQDSTINISDDIFEYLDEFNVEARQISFLFSEEELIIPFFNMITLRYCEDVIDERRNIYLPYEVYTEQILSFAINTVYCQPRVKHNIRCNLIYSNNSFVRYLDEDIFHYA